MEIREGLLYAKSHEWVKEEGDVVTIGLTDYAQSELGDLVFVNLPEEGDSVSVGEAFGDVESVKAVSSFSDTSFTLINHASYGAPLIDSGASKSSSLISHTTPETGEYTSETAFTDSTSPNASPTDTRHM